VEFVLVSHVAALAMKAAPALDATEHAVSTCDSTL
jgi:hypothetical protein